MWLAPFRSFGRGFRALFLLGPESSRNPAMEGLRAFAVLLVFLVHGVGAYLDSFRHIEPNRYNSFYLPGVSELTTSNKVLLATFRSHMGVDLFFLLSGFLICRVASRIDSVGGYGKFLWRRFLRIYPAFLVSLLVCVWLFVSVWHYQQFEKWNFLGNAVMLYGCPYVNIQPHNHVTWSLFWEVAFYVIFPILLVLGRRAARADNVWQPLATVGLLAVGAVGLGFQARVAMFYFGSLLALASDERLRQMASRLPVVLVLGVYLLADMAFRLVPMNFAWWTPFYGVAASLLVVKVCYGQGWLTRLFACLPLRWLGNLSYSFYLVHGTCVSGAWYLSTLTGLPRSQFGKLATFLGLTMALSLASSMVLFLLCERWYFLLGSHRKATHGRRPPQVDPALAPAEAVVQRQAA